MELLRTISEIRQAVTAARAEGRTITFVPTMGALHEGHLSLIDAACRYARKTFVVVSIFVNPTQFAPGEDLEAYPRTLEADLNVCEARDADVVFAPGEEEMYANGRAGSLTTVHVEKLGETLCGKSRPTHFDGVCTVVAKLFNIVQPDAAFFGQKDYQQVAIIRQMVSDLNMPVEVIDCPIIREADGLAMSSRNAYLSEEERAQAPALFASLQLARRMVAESYPSTKEIIDAMKSHLAQNAPLGKVDYIQMVDPVSLEDVETTNQPAQIALAVKFPSARLIDNIRAE